MTPASQSVLDQLERHGPMTIRQLMKRCDVSKTYMAKCVSSLHRAEEIHISGWPEQSNGMKAALWKYGNGDDATNHAGAPSVRVSLMRRLKDASASGQFGPFSCLLVQMGVKP